MSLPPPTEDQETIQIRLGDQTKLDAGLCMTQRDAGSAYRLILPPVMPLFDQVVQYLERQPVARDFHMMGDDEAYAAIAVCVRWGSYFAVLANPDVPLWPVVRRRSTDIGRIADEEMARMNIEITAALAQWLRIKRTESARYRHLVQAALQLPMPDHLVSFRNEIKSTIEGVAKMQAIFRRAVPDAVIQRDTDRVLANALVYSFWRNNSELEDIHAGNSAALPLKQRRITAAEEKRLLRRIATAYSFYNYLLHEMEAAGKPANWSAQATLLLDLMTHPTGWTLDEVTRPVELWGTEPSLPGR